MGWISDKFLGFLEAYGGKIASWAWTKRWGKRKYHRYMSQSTGKVYKLKKKNG